MLIEEDVISAMSPPSFGNVSCFPSEGGTFFGLLATCFHLSDASVGHIFLFVCLLVVRCLAHGNEKGLIVGLSKEESEGFVLVQAVFLLQNLDESSLRAQFVCDSMREKEAPFQT